MSDGSEFQVCGGATENARRANSVRVLASEDRRGRTGTADWIRSFMYAGVVTRTREIRTSSFLVSVRLQIGGNRTDV